MGMRAGATSPSWRQLAWKLSASAAIVVMLSACNTSKTKKKHALRSVNTNFGQPAQAKFAEPKNPLHRATTYWAGQYQKNPKDPRAALAYARNLKALGSTKRALMVLSQAHRMNPSNTEIAGEYGRLVLAQGNMKLAQRLLKQATSARRGADWKVLSAQGAVHAKLGQHEKAQHYFLAALQQKPDAPSVLNNLALSYAMSGKADDAEKLLRRAVKDGRDTARMRQNLALVLGVQGKFDEARQLAEVDLSQEQVRKNENYMRDMVPERKAVSQAKPPAATSAMRGTKGVAKPKSLTPPSQVKAKTAAKRQPTPKAAAKSKAKPSRQLAKATGAPAAEAGNWTTSVRKESSHAKTAPKR